MAVTTKYDLVVNDVVVQCTFASILYSEKLGHQIYFWHFGHQPLTFVHEELAHILGLYQTPRFVNPPSNDKCSRKPWQRKCLANLLL